MEFSLLKWEDRLRSHPAYIKTAISAAQVGYDLHPLFILLIPCADMGIITRHSIIG